MPQQSRPTEDHRNMGNFSPTRRSQLDLQVQSTNIFAVILGTRTIVQEYQVGVTR